MFVATPPLRRLLSGKSSVLSTSLPNSGFFTSPFSSAISPSLLLMSTRVASSLLRNSFNCSWVKAIMLFYPVGFMIVNWLYPC